MRAAWPSLALAGLLALQVAPAAAQPADDASLNEARELFSAGKAAFEAGDYEQAIAQFEKARAVRPSPILEYNIALAWEKLGRLDLAASGFEAYLRQDPQAANRADVEQRIADIRARMAKEGAYATPPPAPPPPTSAPPPAEPPPPGTSAPVAPPPPETPRRYAVSLRLGLLTSGGLGKNALDGNSKIDGSGRLLGLTARVALPMDNLQVDAGLESASFAGAGHMDRIAIRSKLAWVVRASTRPIDVVFAVGIDVNFLSYRYHDTSEVSRQVDLGPTFGGLLEIATLRYRFADHWEAQLAPITLHLLRAVPSNQKQVQDTSGTNVPAARALDLDKPSGAYSLEAGIAYRF